MSDHLPDRLTNSSAVKPWRAAIAITRAENELFDHDLREAVILGKAEISSLAAADAARCCLQEQLRTLAYGRAVAGDDPVALAFVKNAAVGQAERDERRLRRAYG